MYCFVDERTGDNLFGQVVDFGHMKADGPVQSLPVCTENLIHID